ncbi:MAG: hypothetical protein GY714_20055 [Desulfobacterales bacterium]|nr:hypothetical protein [Desulfobacterales bacterium]
MNRKLLNREEVERKLAEITNKEDYEKLVEEQAQCLANWIDNELIEYYKKRQFLTNGDNMYYFYAFTLGFGLVLYYFLW